MDLKPQANSLSNSFVVVTLNEKDLECPICIEQFNDKDKGPVTLPCGHDLCMECLNRTIKGNKYRCPVCMSYFPHTTKYQSNHNKRSIISRMKSVEMCQLHDKMLEYICVTERRSLCSECLFLEDHSQHKKARFGDSKQKSKEASDLKYQIQNQLDGILADTIKTVNSSEYRLKMIVAQTFDQYINQLRVRQGEINKEVTQYFEKLKSETRAKYAVSFTQSDSELQKFLNIEVKNVNEINYDLLETDLDMVRTQVKDIVEKCKEYVPLLPIPDNASDFLKHDTASVKQVCDSIKFNDFGYKIELVEKKKFIEKQQDEEEKNQQNHQNGASQSSNSVKMSAIANNCLDEPTVISEQSYQDVYKKVQVAFKGREYSKTKKLINQALSTLDALDYIDKNLSNNDKIRLLIWQLQCMRYTSSTKEEIERAVFQFTNLLTMMKDANDKFIFQVSWQALESITRINAPDQAIKNLMGLLSSKIQYLPKQGFGEIFAKYHYYEGLWAFYNNNADKAMNYVKQANDYIVNSKSEIYIKNEILRLDIGFKFKKTLNNTLISESHQLLKQLENCKGPFVEYKATLFELIGDVHQVRDETELAQNNYQRAETLLEDKYGEFHESVARLNFKLGNVLYDMDYFNECIECFNRSLVAKQICYGPKDTLVVENYMRLGDVYRVYNMPESAKEHYQNALESASELPEDSKLAKDLEYKAKLKRKAMTGR